MQLKYGLKPETYKLKCGTLNLMNPIMIEQFPKDITLYCARGDRAAFQIILSGDEEFALNTGDSPWFSQLGKIPIVRLARPSDFDCSLNIIDMHIDDDRFLKADALLTQSVLEMKKNEIRSVYVEIKIPTELKAGNYSCSMGIYQTKMFEDEKKTGEVTINLEVADYVMPSPCDFKFHLDLWQHNSNIARKHETPLWSDEHFAVLENYVRSLSDLGQKAVTLIVSNAPWSGQWCHLEERIKANLYEYSIIPITKKSNGSFIYDYTKMQRYIDLCAKYKIDKEISLYGLANVWCDSMGGFDKIAPDYPDGIKLRYFDESDNTYKYMHKAGEIDSYIISLEQYFINSGQIDKVRLVADEPANVEAYRKSIEHIKKIAPSFKLKAALNHSEFIPEFGREVSDFVPSLNAWTNEFDKISEYKRTMKDKRFLWYVCNQPPHPNTLLRSDLHETLFIGVITAFMQMDGFLRWNYTVWTDEPRKDIRYFGWGAGDTNFVYPASNGAPLLSLRYKALRRAIELCELLNALREKCDKDIKILEGAFDFVVKEKSVNKYFDKDKLLPLDQMCSTDYNDYNEMKKYILTHLSK